MHRKRLHAIPTYVLARHGLFNHPYGETNSHKRLRAGEDGVFGVKRSKAFWSILLVLVLLQSATPVAHAQTSHERLRGAQAAASNPAETTQPSAPVGPPETEKPSPTDLLTDEEALIRLQEIFARRARLLLTDKEPPSIESDYMAGRASARWALDHEKAKVKYVQQWVKNRGVRMVEVLPQIQIKRLNKTDEKVRFYVTQSLGLGYSYPGEQTVNHFGVGSRHIVDLRPQDGRWVISLEWYSDPLGEEQEVPAAAQPIERHLLLGEQPLPVAGRKPYDREGAVKYADTYCGIAWGCGNDNRYNTRYRDYTGEGGNCSNFASQVLRNGGGMSIPLVAQVGSLVGHLRGIGRASVSFRGRFQVGWSKALQTGQFPKLVEKGDLIAYQLKGKMAHVSVVTAFDSRGYPMVNSHTADRYHVPFDLGWDRSTIYWFVQVW